MLLQSAIEKFGQRLGMPALTPDASGVTALDIDGVGRLYLEISDKSGHEELLAYLTRTVPPHDSELARRALRFCHFARARALPVWTGLHRDNLMVLTRFTAQEATGQTLENAALFLAESLNTIIGGGE